MFPAPDHAFQSRFAAPGIPADRETLFAMNHARREYEEVKNRPYYIVSRKINLP
jgi:hypothetical protein